MVRNSLTRVDSIGRNDPLAYEANEERARTLGNLDRRLRAALEAIRRFDERSSSGVAYTEDERKSLIDAAALAMWELCVFRDSCGLTHTDRAVREYCVPIQVVARVGAVRPQ